MSSDELDRCPVCSAEKKDGFVAEYVPDANTWENIYRCTCQICGRFEICVGVVESIQTELKGKTHLLSGVLRDRSEKNIKEKILNIEDAKRLIQSAPRSETFLDKRDRLLLFLESKSDNLATPVELRRADFPLMYLHNSQELDMLSGKVGELGYIKGLAEFPDKSTILLEEKGWERIEQLRQSTPLSDQAFVAMWFDPQMNEAFDRGIRPALLATGYRPLRIDLKEFNNDICDEIRGEIRRSAFVVADFTGNRPGVYFEAGFGMGLGLQVIWTCHKDWMEKVHFDTNHYSHIVWSEPEELRKRLENRIRATLPLRPPLPENGKDQ